MNIKYNQLCIRNAEKKDCEQLAVWWNDGTVMAHAGFPNGLGTSAAEIEKQIADDSDETRRRLIIEYNDVRIGEMSFYVFENHRYEIGIKICESDYQEIRSEPAPDNQACFLESPYFGNTVIDDIRDRENDQSGGGSNAEYLDDFGF